MTAAVRWLLACLLDFALLPVWFVGAPIVSLFTRAMPPAKSYDWGGWWGTYDNPPQGGRDYQENYAPFRQWVGGWRGYVNRVFWVWRNPGYGFQRRVSYQKQPGDMVATLHRGAWPVNDRKKQPGAYLMTARTRRKLVAFEFYAVIPYPFWPSKCLRVRLGYKLNSSKYREDGFAPFVNTVNPFKTYGP